MRTFFVVLLMLVCVPVAAAEQTTNPPGLVTLARGLAQIRADENNWTRCGLSIPRCRHGAALRIYAALQLVDDGSRVYFLNFRGCEYTNADVHRFRAAEGDFAALARQPTTSNAIKAVNAMADYRQPLANKIRQCHL